jgi:hypothetical protein
MRELLYRLLILNVTASLATYIHTADTYYLPRVCLSSSLSATNQPVYVHACYIMYHPYNNADKKKPRTAASLPAALDSRYYGVRCKIGYDDVISSGLAAMVVGGVKVTMPRRYSNKSIPPMGRVAGAPNSVSLQLADGRSPA